MPTYDYVCDNCGYEFEYFQSMTEPVLTDCPQCKQKNCVRRLIGCGAGIIFKGSGFYETDYKRKSSSPSCGCTHHGKTNGSASKSKNQAESKSQSDAQTAGSTKNKTSSGGGKEAA